MPLHPDCAAYLKSVAEWATAQGLPSFWQMPGPRARQVYRDAILASKPPLAPMELAEDRTIPTRGGPRRVRILRPPVADGERLPVMLYLHSGGYVIGGIDESEQEARRFAASIPALVVSASYRLAPEHHFPAAVDDAYDALLWVAQNAAAHGGDADRLIVGGCSAGGGLAAILSRLAPEAGGPRIALAVLLCPWLDLTMSQPSVVRYGKGFDLDVEFLDWFVATYFDRHGKADDPLASPLLYPVPESHATTIVLGAECDPLFDEARFYVGKLRAAGVRATFIEAPGMIHAFNEITHLIPAGAPLLRPLDAAIKAAIG